MRKQFATAVATAAVCVSSVSYSADTQKALPLFTVMPADAPWHHATVRPGSQLAQWNGSFTDLKGNTINYTMVGADPSNTNSTTTIPVVIVPVKMIYGLANGHMTFNPKIAKLSNGQTVLKNTLQSPLFRSEIDFVQGGVDLGTTQYIDAFQRGNFWSFVSGNNHYHVKLGKVTVAPVISYKVPPEYGQVESNPFGSGVVGTMYINVFDRKIQDWMSQISEINPGVLPIFLTYDIYLTEYEAVCCIGGYHSATGSQPGGQTYAYATYVDSPGAFSQDVSALSHEVGEWQDDPFIDNHVNCKDNSLMEVGDPLENNANYGDYPYTVNGFTYNLQSLVFIGYFGAPPSTSVNSWLSFQDDESSVCPGQ